MSKYPRTFHLPYSEGVSSDDKVLKSVKPFINVPIVITEKLDGENQAITSGGVYARSHSTFTENQWACKSWELYRRIKNDTDLREGVYLFGENMYAIHSIEYKYLTDYFYLFGVRDGETFLSWDDVELFAHGFSLPKPPVLFKGEVKTEAHLQDLVELLVKKPSILGAKQMEGCVVRLQSSFEQSDFSQSVCKWVRKDHVTTDVHWTKNYKVANILV